MLIIVWLSSSLLNRDLLFADLVNLIHSLYPSSLSYRFKTHLNAHAPKDVLSAEEYEGLLEESKQIHKTEKAELAEGEDELPPGEEKEPTEVDYKWQIPSSVGLRFNMRFNVFQMLPK